MVSFFLPGFSFTNIHQSRDWSRKRRLFLEVLSTTSGHIDISREITAESLPNSCLTCNTGMIVDAVSVIRSKINLKYNSVNTSNQMLVSRWTSSNNSLVTCAKSDAKQLRIIYILPENHPPSTLPSTPTETHCSTDIRHNK